MHATEAASQGAMRRLRAQEIAVAYGAVEALRPFSLMVEPGSLVVVLGPNGAGKTSLLKALAGLASLRSGRVFLGELEA
ncbi:MAG: ATP-binding cassette domain-containing protein [Hyphomicrobiales bacterium]